MTMNKLLLGFGVLLAGALLIPDVADAQRGGGGARMGGGGFGGGGARMGGGGFRGGSFGGGSRMYVPRGGVTTVGSIRGGAIAARPGVGAGGFRQAAINNPGRFDNRVGNRGDWRYGYGARGGRYPYYGGRYPYYGGRYPYYGGWGWGAAGLATGAVIGAAATYPYYNNYPYSTYPYSTYQTPVASAQSWRVTDLDATTSVRRTGMERSVRGGEHLGPSDFRRRELSDAGRCRKDL
jgi:hypothetical protein